MNNEVSDSQTTVPKDACTTAVYPGHRVLLMCPIYNEAAKLPRFVHKLKSGVVDKVVVVNDGSTDEGPDILRRNGIEVLDQPRRGIGACIKRCVTYARDHGYDILVVMAANGKDDPLEVPRLIEPIIHDGAHYVQGSRFLTGGKHPNLPTRRRMAIKLLSALFTLYSRKSCTDLTNGFRAYRISLFDDPKIDIWQDWLDTYEYEYYLHWKVYTLGYPLKEVAVTKSYPEDKGEKYTKIRPFTDWWKMLRPLVFLALRIKK